MFKSFERNTCGGGKKIQQVNDMIFEMLWQNIIFRRCQISTSRANLEREMQGVRNIRKIDTILDERIAMALNHIDVHGLLNVKR